VGARNQVGIGLSYRPVSLCSLATQFQTRFLESIPRPIAGLKIPTLEMETGRKSEKSKVVFSLLLLQSKVTGVCLEKISDKESSANVVIKYEEVGDRGIVTKKEIDRELDLAEC
jgi:hypothetical protein